MNLPIEKIIREIVQEELLPLKNLLNQIASNNGNHLPQKLLTTKQAADYLGMSTSWMEQKRSKGGGPAYSKIGGKIKYQIESLEEFKQQQLRRHTADLGPEKINKERKTSKKLYELGKRSLKP